MTQATPSEHFPLFHPPSSVFITRAHLQPNPNPSSRPPHLSSRRWLVRCRQLHHPSRAGKGTLRDARQARLLSFPTALTSTASFSRFESTPAPANAPRFIGCWLRAHCLQPCMALLEPTVATLTRYFLIHCCSFTTLDNRVHRHHRHHRITNPQACSGPILPLPLTGR
jgi:hypothetical protein